MLRSALCLALWAFPLGLIAPLRGELILQDDFSANEPGGVPTGWASDHKWRTRQIGGRMIVGEEDETAHGNRPLTKVLSRQLEQSWILEFDYAWMWGGTQKHGFNDLRLDVDLVDKAGNGYRLRMPQGRQRTGMESGLVEENELFALYRIRAGKPAVILGEGAGYDAPGWKVLSLPRPALNRVRVTWDRLAGRLTVYRRQNDRWDEVIRSDEAADSRLDKLVFNPSLLQNGCTPQIANVTLRAPAELAWGVCGHADVKGEAFPAYRDIGAAEAVRRVREMGLSHYRVDTFGVTERPDGSSLFDQVVLEANRQGVTLLPILYAGNTAGVPTERLYEKARNRARNFARYYREQFKYIEIANEMDLGCLLPGRSGALVTDYDPEKLARAAEVIRGLCDGVRDEDPAMQRLVGTAGWYHHGFIDALLQRGVQFEILAWHWYSEMGSMQRVMAKLSSYGKPIWMTEFSRRDGAFRGLRESDGLTSDAIGKAPPGWTASGDWIVQSVAGELVVTNRDKGAGSGRTLMRNFSTPLDDSWLLETRAGWQWGDGGGSNGNPAIWIDYDLVDAAGRGYRLRVHPGDGGKPANDDKTMRLFLLEGGGAREIARGKGPNKSGWLSRGLKAPDFDRIALQWEKTTRTFTAFYGEGGAQQKSFRVTNGEDFKLERLVVRAAMYDNNEGPQLASLKLRVNDRRSSEAEQAETLRAMVREIAGFPLVRALFVYELFDEAPAGTTENPEHYYGLHSVRLNPATNRFEVAQTRPAAEALRALMKARGALPAPAGETVAERLHPRPAFEIQNSVARFSPYVAEQGRHAVFVRLPASVDADSRVPAVVRHLGGASDVAVVPKGAGAWVWLGDFDFGKREAGEGASVEFGVSTPGAVLPEAVLFQRKQVGLLDGADIEALNEPDVDGVPVLVKLATVLPVGVKTTSAPMQIAMDGDRLSLSFRRLEPAPASYTVEASNDMKTWTPLATLLRGESSWRGAVRVDESGSGGIRTARLSDLVGTSTAPQRFVRLRLGEGEVVSEPQGYVVDVSSSGAKSVRLVPEPKSATKIK